MISIGKYKNYTDACLAVQSLGIISESDYRNRYKSDPRLHSKPDHYYHGKGWIDWYHYLNRRRNQIVTFPVACRIVRAARISTKEKYNKVYKKYPGLPASPRKSYASSWVSWQNFLNAGRSVFYSFEHTQRVIRQRNCRSLREYRQLCNELPDLPFNPAETYKDMWKGYRVFFNTEREPYYTWEQTLEIIRFEEFDSREEYIAFAQSVDLRLPTNAHTIYKKHWNGWLAFLGNDWKKKYSFEECKSIVALHKLNSLQAYLDLRSALRDWRMPKDPRKYYLKCGWQGMRDFLSKPSSVKKYSTIDEAMLVTRTLGIRSCTEYQNLKRYKEDQRLPSMPERVYAKQWTSWTSFLGSKQSRYYSFLEARLVARIYGWRTSGIYKFACSTDPRLPTCPESYYREEGWKNWSDFLGIELHSYKQAVVLLKQKGVISYKAYFELVRKDSRFPAQPQKWYREHWINWPTFFSRAVTLRKEHPAQLHLYVSNSARAL